MAEKVRYLQVGTVAEMLACTKDHIYHLIRTGQVKAVKIGSRAMRVCHASLNSYLNRNIIEPTEKELE